MVGKSDRILNSNCLCSASLSNRCIFGPLFNEQNLHKSVNAVKFSSSFCGSPWLLLVNICWDILSIQYRVYSWDFPIHKYSGYLKSISFTCFLTQFLSYSFRQFSFIDVTFDKAIWLMITNDKWFFFIAISLLSLALYDFLFFTSDPTQSSYTYISTLSKKWNLKKNSSLSIIYAPWKINNAHIKYNFFFYFLFHVKNRNVKAIEFLCLIRKINNNFSIMIFFFGTLILAKLESYLRTKTIIFTKSNWRKKKSLHKKWRR